jgi:hypothetical protein
MMSPAFGVADPLADIATIVPPPTAHSLDGWCALML